MEYSSPLTHGADHPRRPNEFWSRVWQTFGPAWIGLVGGALTMGIGVTSYSPVLRNCAATYEKFPSESPSWLFGAITLPESLQVFVCLFGFAALFGIGPITAWSLRGRDRFSQFVASLVTGLSASFMAYLLWIGAMVSASTVIMPSIPDLTLFAESTKQSANSSGGPSDVLVERYSDLKETPPDDRGGIVFAKIVSDQVSGSAHGVRFGVGFALISVGSVASGGTMIVSWLYRRGGSFGFILGTYLALTLSAVATIRGIVVQLTAYSTDTFSDAFFLAGLVGSTVLFDWAMVRRWNILLRISAAVTYTLFLTSNHHGSWMLLPLLGMAIVGFQVARGRFAPA